MITHEEYQPPAGILGIANDFRGSHILHYAGDYTYDHSDLIMLYNRLNKANFKTFSTEEEMKEFAKLPEVKKLLKQRTNTRMKIFFSPRFRDKFYR